MNNYIFPFSTCEIPNKDGIIQPYSTLINIISSLLVIYFITKSNNIHSKLFLLSILIFTLVHTYSHYTHENNNLQFLLVHFSAILFSILLLNILYQKTKIVPSDRFIYIMICLYIFDIYLVNNNYSNIYSITSFIIILLVIMSYYYSHLSSNLKHNIYIIIIVTIITLIFQINEIYNCKKMLEIYPNFPYHVIVEILTSISIYILCSSFYILNS
jgi:hypothetical protein